MALPTICVSESLRIIIFPILISLWTSFLSQFIASTKDSSKDPTKAILPLGLEGELSDGLLALPILQHQDDTRVFNHFMTESEACSTDGNFMTGSVILVKSL